MQPLQSISSNYQQMKEFIKSSPQIDIRKDFNRNKLNEKVQNAADSPQYNVELLYKPRTKNQNITDMSINDSRDIIIEQNQNQSNKFKIRTTNIRRPFKLNTIAVTSPQNFQTPQDLSPTKSRANYKPSIMASNKKQPRRIQNA